MNIVYQSFLKSIINLLFIIAFVNHLDHATSQCLVMFIVSAETSYRYISSTTRVVTKINGHGDKRS